MADGHLHQHRGGVEAEVRGDGSPQRAGFFVEENQQRSENQQGQQGGEIAMCRGEKQRGAERRRADAGEFLSTG